MAKIYYVAGLGGSGSTILEMMIASGGYVVGLGEVRVVFSEEVERSRERMCTCGVKAADCAFWGPTLDRLEALGKGASFEERYKVLLQMVDEIFGSDVSIADSSKRLDALQALRAIGGPRPIETLFIIKDVRAYAISILDRRTAKGSRFRPPIPGAILMRWYLRNRRLQQGLRLHSERPPLVLTYEGLCLRIQQTAARMRTHFGESLIDPDASPASGISHGITGNMMRLDDKRRRTVKYDSRWFYRNEWMRPYVLMPWVRRYNRKVHEEEGVIEITRSSKVEPAPQLSAKAAE